MQVASGTTRNAGTQHNTVAVRVRVLGHRRCPPLHTTRLCIGRGIQRDVAATPAMPLRGELNGLEEG